MLTAVSGRKLARDKTFRIFLIFVHFGVAASRPFLFKIMSCIMVHPWNINCRMRLQFVRFALCSWKINSRFCQSVVGRGFLEHSSGAYKQSCRPQERTQDWIGGMAWNRPNEECMKIINNKKIGLVATSQASLSIFTAWSTTWSLEWLTPGLNKSIFV